MHPTLAVGLVVLTWLVVRNRSTVSRMLLGAAALLLGWEPATAGSTVGHVLLLIAAGIAASLLWDRLRRPIRADDQQALGQLPPDDNLDRFPVHPPATSAAVDGSALTTPGGPVGAPVETLLDPLDEPLTELDRSEAYGLLLEANVEGLHEAQEAGDVRAQAAFAGEIAALAQDMRSLLRVVVGERRRLRG